MFKWILVFCMVFVSPETSLAQDPGPFYIRDKTPLLAQLKQAGNDTNKVQLLLNLSNEYLRRPDNKRTDIDSSLYFARAAEQLGGKLHYYRGIGNSYLLMSWIYPNLQQTEIGKNYAIQAIEISARQKDYALSGESYFALSGYYSFSETDLKERIRLVILSLLSFRKANFKLKEGLVLKELGDLYMLQGDHGQALATLKNALKVLKSVNFKELDGVYDLLGRVYMNLGDAQQAINYGLLALQNAKLVGDTSLQMCTFYNRVGLTYGDMKDYKRAYYYLKISLRIAIKFNDALSIHEVAANTASILNKLNRPKEAFSLLEKTLEKYPILKNRELLEVAPAFIISLKKLHKYKEARQYCNELLDIVARSEPDDEVLSEIYATIIPFYLDIGDEKPASKYIPLHRQLSIKSKNKINESENFLWQSRLDSLRGNYMATIKNYQSYSFLKDSILTRQN